MSIIKCVVVGDPSVGKSSLLSALWGDFPPQHQMTVQSSAHISEISLGRGKKWSFMMYDTTSEDSTMANRLRPLIYPDTDIVLLCFSVHSTPTLSNVKYKWAPEIQHHLKGTPYILVGTKSDLRSDPDTIQHVEQQGLTGREFISQDLGVETAADIGALKYLECSAQDRTSVQSVVDFAAKVVIASRGKRDKADKAARKDKEDCIVM